MVLGPQGPGRVGRRRFFRTRPRGTRPRGRVVVVGHFAVAGACGPYCCRAGALVACDPGWPGRRFGANSRVRRTGAAPPRCTADERDAEVALQRAGAQARVCQRDAVSETRLRGRERRAEGAARRTVAPPLPAQGAGGASGARTVHVGAGPQAGAHTPPASHTALRTGSPRPVWGRAVRRQPRGALRARSMLTGGTCVRKVPGPADGSRDPAGARRRAVGCLEQKPLEVGGFEGLALQAILHGIRPARVPAWRASGAAGVVSTSTLTTAFALPRRPASASRSSVGWSTSFHGPCRVRTGIPARSRRLRARIPSSPAARSAGRPSTTGACCSCGIVASTASPTPSAGRTICWLGRRPGDAGPERAGRRRAGPPSAGAWRR
jgi:hypothetical protein